MCRTALPSWDPKPPPPHDDSSRQAEEDTSPAKTIPPRKPKDVQTGGTALPRQDLKFKATTLDDDFQQAEAKTSHSQLCPLVSRQARSNQRE